ncbi:MAG TPA: ABC transporter permease [Chloroflexi bacterium]|nr:ABC transporter permease [Chloroflexota bacterium]
MRGVDNMREGLRNRIRRLSAIIQKEAIQILRDRGTLVMLLLMPVLEMFLFAYAVSLTVDHIPTAVADASMDAQSRAFVGALVASGYFDIDMYVADETQVIQAIDEGRVKAGIVIPPNFAAQIERGEAQALVILDGSDAASVSSGYSAANAVAQSWAMGLTVEKVARVGAASLGGDISLPIRTSTRVLYNPDRDDMIFIVPGLIAILLQVMTIGQAATAVVRERELGVTEQILITPARPIELLIGKMVPNLVLAVIVMLIVVLFGIFWFGVPFKGNPWSFVWLSLLFIISGLGLGLLISTVAKTQRQARQITLLFMLLCMLLTGLIYPRQPMPPIVKAVSNLIPATYFVRIARGIITKGVGLSFMWADVLVLVVYSVVVVVVSALTFKKRLD